MPAVHVQRRVSEVASRGQTMLRLTRSAAALITLVIGVASLDVSQSLGAGVPAGADAI
jgi:hypothetical protein